MAKITRDNLLRDIRTQHAAPSVPDDGLTPWEFARLPIGSWTRYHGLLLFGGATHEALREHAFVVAEMAALATRVSPRALLGIARDGASVEQLSALVQWQSYDHALRAVVSAALEDDVQACDSATLAAVAAVPTRPVLELAIQDIAARCSDGQA